MNKKFLLSIFFFNSIFFSFICCSVIFAQPAADQELLENIIPNTKIEAYQNNQIITKKNNNNEIVIETVHYIGLEDYISPDVKIVFKGTNVQPDLPILISLKPADNKIKKTTVNAAGSWQTEFSLNDLPTGKSTAFLQTEIAGQKSKEIGVALFYVADKNQLTQKDFYLAVSLMILLLILLGIIIWQLRKNTKEISAKYIL